MKYKIGDKVKVRNDLKVLKRYGDYTFVERMEKYKGKLVTISEAFPGFYHIKEDKNEHWGWTEQMFESVVELTAEEAIKIQAEMCNSISDCANCPIYKEIDSSLCESFKAENPGKVVEIIKQWKKDHEKKEIETENITLIKVMKEEGDDETCIYTYEIDVSKEIIDEKMKELVKLIRQYYKENGDKIYAKCEHICRVKS